MNKNKEIDIDELEKKLSFMVATTYLLMTELSDFKPHQYGLLNHKVINSAVWMLDDLARESLALATGTEFPSPVGETDT